MHGNTNAQRWRQALLSALSGAAAQVGSAVVLLWLRSRLPAGGVLSIVLLILALVTLAALIPLGLSLRQRYYEILGGEEDAAGKY